jgi:hypothetical protein
MDMVRHHHCHTKAVALSMVVKAASQHDVAGPFPAERGETWCRM